MSLNRPHHILHRMVPLICQAMTTRPYDEAVWVEGLTMLCDPKLHRSMSLTYSIWLALLLRALESSRPPAVILAALRLLGEMKKTLEPMKSCLLKPLTALVKLDELDAEIGEELKATIGKLGLTIPGMLKKPFDTLSVSLVPHSRLRDRSRECRHIAHLFHL